MSLFDGVENFTPAFQGQQLAIAAGGGAASAFTGGMNAGTSKQNADLNQQQFDFQKQRYFKQVQDLDKFSEERRRSLGGGETDYEAPPYSWQ